MMPTDLTVAINSASACGEDFERRAASGLSFDDYRGYRSDRGVREREMMLTFPITAVRRSSRDYYDVAFYAVLPVAERRLRGERRGANSPR
ncbi:hypothetical protein N183_26945 [Sinorhizobium sp. Sb3]|nr:hypothetical protein N183_26945 [Sinorhizobium sp. Sb3]